MNFWKEFKTFITKGNVMDMAVGVIIGGMFTKIVNSVVNDILMPFISLLTGRTSFENMFIVINPGTAENAESIKTLADATNAGASVIAYGNLIQLVIQFLITAFCLFVIIKAMNTLREKTMKLNPLHKILHKKEAEAELPAQQEPQPIDQNEQTKEHALKP